jgi:hypothetical protein
MKRISLILAAFFGIALCGQANPAPLVGDQTDQFSLDLGDIWRLEWIYDQEKLARDLNRKLFEDWEDQNFSNTAVANQRHMNELEATMNHYGLNPPAYSDQAGTYRDEEHVEMFAELQRRAEEGPLEAIMAVAYLQELNIVQYRAYIELSEEKPLRNTFERLLAGNKNHLRLFAWLVSYLTPPEHYYHAQMLGQQDVDTILRLEGTDSSAEFQINAGLNGAWYYPATPGQGFFVTVYPDSKTVLVAWMTYDTEPPAAGVQNHLGNASQRWLVAQGEYEGSYAGLRLLSFKGGLFDSGTRPSHFSVGSFRLQFESCSSASAMYYLPDIGLESTIPLQRIAPDNIARCEAGE